MRTFAVLAVALLPVSLARADEIMDPALKSAIDKGLKRIEAGVTNYPRHRQCFSCHHQAMAVFSMTAARQRGFNIDEALLQKQIDFSLRSFRHKSIIAKGQGVGGDSTSVVYALHTFAVAGHPYDDTIAALVKYLLARQRKDGAWPVPAQRPPTMGSLFTNTALALFTLKEYGPPVDAPDAAKLKEGIDSALDRGRAWLLANKPSVTEDKVFHLRGLVYAAADRQQIEAARADLLRDQHVEGGWAQLPGMSADAYATGTVLAALGHARLGADHDAYKKGVKYLLDAQDTDGAWIVKTRSRPLQPFFDNGDAGGKSQFISFAATNWAVIALLQAVPPSSPKR